MTEISKARSLRRAARAAAAASAASTSGASTVSTVSTSGAVAATIPSITNVIDGIVNPTNVEDDMDHEGVEWLNHDDKAKMLDFKQFIWCTNKKELDLSL